MSKKPTTYQLPSHSFSIPNREDFHRTYAGPIYASDFNTEYSSGTMASRIAASERFNQQCRKDSNLRDMRKAFQEQKNETEEDFYVTKTNH